MTATHKIKYSIILSVILVYLRVSFYFLGILSMVAAFTFLLLHKTETHSSSIIRIMPDFACWRIVYLEQSDRNKEVNIRAS